MMRIEDGVCVGSGRSIPNVDLHERLERVSDLFSHFGGHAYACGFTVATAKLDALRSRLDEAFEELDESVFTKSIDVDGEIALRDICESFAAEHEALEPFGAGNPQPHFAVRALGCASTREFAAGCHELNLRDATGSGRGVLWPSAGELLPVVMQQQRFDALVQVERDRYAPNGVRLNLVDAAPEGVRLQ
jgi:Single-stranded DNA-specific exonuclease